MIRTICGVFVALWIVLRHDPVILTLRMLDRVEWDEPREHQVQGGEA